MLIDTSITVAYKCSSCGSFDFRDISLFQLLNGKQFFSTCRCNNSCIIITENSAREFEVIIDCISCGDKHLFFMKRKEFMKMNTSVFCCPNTGMQQCFIGNGDIVRKKVDGLEKELDQLIDMFGYDDYFTNTRVMYDSVNKIHDIAEKGNLSCQCGCKDMDISLFSDYIRILCKNCNAWADIGAASNRDLRDLMGAEEIFLVKRPDFYDNKNTLGYVKKTDRK